MARIETTTEDIETLTEDIEQLEADGPEDNIAGVPQNLLDEATRLLSSELTDDEAETVDGLLTRLIEASCRCPDCRS